MHTHSRAGVAVSTLSSGLLPISQYALRFYGRVGYHDYEGATLVPGERERLQQSMGENNVLILRNHGLLSTGALGCRGLRPDVHAEQCLSGADRCHAHW